MSFARALRIFLALGLACSIASHARAGPGDTCSGATPNVGTRLIEAYPEVLEKVDGNWLVWRDGTRMPLDDGTCIKPPSAWIDAPDIEDMLRIPYPAGIGSHVPAPDSDPGRARNAAFFAKMYGDCRKGEVKPRLKTIVWLPKKTRQRLEITAVNGVAERLLAISRELDDLPAEFDRYLAPSGGTYNCRTIAGTKRVSAHGFGIAIDLAVSPSDYWRWAPGMDSGRVTYRNRIPLEIVHIFERHGFIWGGRWYHYDTMHFEYRPELLPPLTPLGSSPDRRAPEK